VVCLRNARRLGVINGTRGTVVELDGANLVIETAAGPRSLPSRYLSAGHLDYGYATTVHKAQGATYDRAFVLATESLTREAGYVAMSRARLSTELFVPCGAIEQGLGPEVPEVEPLTRTASRLSVSRSKALASSHLGAEPIEGGVLKPLAIPGPILGRKGSDMRVDPPLSTDSSTESRTTGTARSVNGLATDFTATDTSRPAPPAYIAAALGPRPAFVDEQPRYDQITQSINDFRARHAVEGDDPLGPRPFEAFERLAYDRVVAEIRAYERCRWREHASPELQPPERGLGMGR
jgi:hypothetical protein